MLISFQQGFTDAGVLTALSTMNMAQTFTHPTVNQDVFTRDLLLGFAMLATAVFAFVPVVGEVVAGAALTGEAAILAAKQGASALGAAGSVTSATLSTSGAFLATSLINKGCVSFLILVN